MADWIDIQDSAVDPDAPVTSELAYAFRDNPIAIAEGAVGAPRIRYYALGGISAGSVDRVHYAGEMSDTSSYSISFSLSQSGSIRVSVSAMVMSGSGTVSIERLRKGSSNVVIQSWALTNSYVIRSVDVPVLIGDSIGIFIVRAAGTVYMKDIKLSTSGEYIWPNGFRVL